MPENIKGYVHSWKKQFNRKYNNAGKTFAAFIIPLVAGAVATGAVKAAKVAAPYVKKEIAKQKKKRKKKR